MPLIGRALTPSLVPKLPATLGLPDRSARPRTMAENHEVAEEGEEEAATEVAGEEEDNERFISTRSQRKKM